MKRKYMIPYIEVSTTELISNLLAGSLNPDNDFELKSDNDPITVSKDQLKKNGQVVDQVDYAKKHNAWSDWDD